MEVIELGNEKNKSAVPEEIKIEIENLLCTKFEMSEDFTSENKNKDFFGLRALLKPRELTYLAYMLEMRYNIRFSVDDYDDPRFYNLTGLSEIVAEMLNNKYVGR